jgi:hypothetical protein
LEGTPSKLVNPQINYSKEVDIEVASSDSSSLPDESSDSDDPLLSALTTESQQTKPLAATKASSSSGSRGPAVGLGEGRVCHIRLKTIHSVHKDEPSKLACGRLCHEGFKLVDEQSIASLADYPHCAGCFGSSK